MTSSQLESNGKFVGMKEVPGLILSKKKTYIRHVFFFSCGIRSILTRIQYISSGRDITMQSREIGFKPTAVELFRYLFRVPVLLVCSSYLSKHIQKNFCHQGIVNLCMQFKNDTIYLYTCQSIQDKVSHQVSKT